MNPVQKLRRPGSSLGIVELPNYTDALCVLDVMLKSSQVNFLTWEKVLGGRLVTIVVQGEVSAVKASVEAANSCGIGKVAASVVIANPHGETMRMIKLSAARQQNKRRSKDGITGVGND